jgi:DNA polymerase III subunit delta
LYLLISDDYFIISYKIKEIIKSNSEAEVIKFDLQDNTLEEVMNALNTLNLFMTKKIVIVYHSENITESKELEQYLNNPLEDNILVMVANSLDERKKITKLLKSKLKLLNNHINMDEIINEELENYQMDQNTRRYLIDYCNHDNDQILNELAKLKLYKLDEQKITKDDINKVVKKNIDDNIFNLVDYIVKKDQKKALEVYNNLIFYGEEPIKIMILVANKIRLIYQVKVLAKEKSLDEISEHLKVHLFPIKLAKEMSYSYSEQELINYLTKLSELDMNIKQGQIMPEMGFRMFIFEL